MGSELLQLHLCSRSLSGAGGRAQLAGHLPEQVDVRVAIFDLVISNAPGALLPTDDPHLLDLSRVQTCQGESNTRQTLHNDEQKEGDRHLQGTGNSHTGTPESS